MTMIKFRASSGDKLISETAFDLLAREVFTLLKEKAPKVHRHDADSIDDSSTKKIPLITKQDEWDRKIDEQRLQQEIQKLSSGLSWKGVYATLTELRAAIQSPKEGDFVIVTQEPTYGNKNTILIYEAESTNDWQEIGDLFLPGIATGSQSGLMSSQDKTKLDNISTDKLLTPEDKQKWNEASDKSKQNETSLNNKVDKTTNINVGDGLCKVEEI